VACEVDSTPYTLIMQTNTHFESESENGTAQKQDQDEAQSQSSALPCTSSTYLIELSIAELNDFTKPFLEVASKLLSYVIAASALACERSDKQGKQTSL